MSTTSSDTYATRASAPAPAPAPDPRVAEALGLAPDAGATRRRRALGLAAALALVAAAVGGVWAWRARAPAEAPWALARVTRGDLTVTVTAVGTLAPSDTVAVGSELSGLVDEVLVDVNDPVTAGQVLARIDTDRLEDELAQARAQEAVAAAGVAQAETTLASARRERARLEGLPPDAVAGQAVDQARDAVAQGEAGLALARAQLRSARAARQAVQTQIDRAIIRSPVDGVVLTRNVEPGQPVVSALQAATLFEVAADLSRLDLVVDVDEADVGRVRAGQAATFAVPAWPDRDWAATVTRVDLAPTPLEQVITYPATLAVVNDEGLLRPGMTATATLVSETIEDVLLVPAAALRFVPPDADDPDVPSVWTLEGETPRAVPVEVVATDGTTTAVAPGALDVGDAVLVERE